MPRSLITINKLIEMLLQEVEAFDFNKYQDILLMKARTTEAIRKKRASFSDINNLANEIIPAQRRIISYYADRIPRIERIINILNKNTHRFSKPSILRRSFSLFSRKKSIISNLHKDEYIYILELLKILVRLGHKNIPSLLEEQEAFLRIHDTKNYLKLFNKERKIGFKFFKPLSKLGVDVDWKVHKKLSIPVKRKLIVLAVITLLYVGVFGAVLHSKFTSKGFVALEECAYQIGATLDKDATAQDVYSIIVKFAQEDLKYESSIETEFEEKTGIGVRGEYTVRDLQLTKTFIERTYGLDRATLLAVTITYLPPDVKLKYIDAKEKKCAILSFNGLMPTTGPILVSSENVSDMNYWGIIAHEFAHNIHRLHSTDFNLGGPPSKFDNEWNKIQGGYARRYGTNNILEDVATVVEAAVVAFLEGKDVMKIKPYDGNYEAFHAKLRLLKSYDFLPPALEVR